MNLKSTNYAIPGKRSKIHGQAQSQWWQTIKLNDWNNRWKKQNKILKNVEKSGDSHVNILIYWLMHLDKIPVSAYKVWYFMLINSSVSKGEKLFNGSFTQSHYTPFFSAQNSYEVFCISCVAFVTRPFTASIKNIRSFTSHE